MKKTFQSKLTQGLLLVVILLLSGFLRLRGLDWDDDFHLHPDERFLTMVETNISPVSSLEEYFNTESSSLNPHNRGHTFFVYGTFPIFLVRYVAEWVQQTGYSQVYVVGRYLSTIFDLGIIVFVFLIARKLFKDKPVIALISALFYGLATLPIQQSHYFTVDTFTNFFITLAFYLAICIFTTKNEVQDEQKKFFQTKDFWNHILFGMVVGLAAASKVNAVVSAILLPLAVLFRDFQAIKNSPERQRQVFFYLVAAAIVCLFIFRVFQPYAFAGPGFFNFSLNEKWLANLSELSALSSGDINYPPSLQWARRPVYFAWQNLLLWGFGLPIGIPALLGIVVMGWKIFKGNWKPYFLLWIWVVLYGGWQSLVWNPTMRYLLFIYPMLAISAAWFTVLVIEKLLTNKRIMKTILAYTLIGVIFIGSVVWAFSFSGIYTREVTRVTATEWIYKNVEGPLNLLISGTDEDFSQPLSYPHYVDITSENPLFFHFSVENDGYLQFFEIEEIQNYSLELSEQTIILFLYQVDGDEISLIQSAQIYLHDWDEYGKIDAQLLHFETAPYLSANTEYALKIELVEQANNLRFSGFITATTVTEAESFTTTIFECAPSLNELASYEVQFTPFEDGALNGIELFRVLDWSATDGEKEILVSIQSQDEIGEVLAQGTVRADFTEKVDFRGSRYSIIFEEPVLVLKDKKYTVTLQVDGTNGDIGIYGSKRLNESSWDDGLPLYMFNYSPFDSYSGVYYSDLNLELYWDDNEEKLERFYTSLEQADYIYITSNRQWGSTTQIPERYPLTTEYYRALLGCPLEEDLQDCYRDAQPGMYSGELGFELVEVFQSEPTIGDFTINTQYAEEAFTVYDHPKVFIFRKTGSFSMDTVRSILGKVDLNKVIYLTPAAASDTPGDLSLSAAEEATQISGGTWSELFSRDALINKYQILGLFVWYIVIFLLGLIVYPSTRIIFRGLKDKGYAFSRLFGLLLITFLVWVLGSASIAVEPWLISLVVLCVALFNAFLFWKERHQIIEEVKNNSKIFIQVELVFLTLFLFFTLVRLGNPDLWHEYKGGEKPMDFAYFNAIIKSSTFPPYDPWYAGGYINYYYFGSLMVGVLTKWLGIIPSVAYNFSLATFFAFVGCAAFGIGWNFQAKQQEKQHDKKSHFSPFQAGLVFTVAVLLIGNLGTINMLMDGFKQVAINSGLSAGNGVFQTIGLWLKGIILVVKGTKFSYYPGDWYWIPSRTIPGEAITEFPYFTFLYGDPHAHLYAYPITLMALGFFLSLIFWEKEVSEGRWKWLFILLGGGLIIGSLAVTNTWDYPVYLLLGVIALGYDHFQRKRMYFRILPQFSEQARRIASFLLSIVLFCGSSYLLFIPYHSTYGAGYTSVQAWQGTHTPISSLLTHWGIFLFFIFSWLCLKTRDWLAATPISYLKKMQPYRSLFIITAAVILGIVVGLVVQGVDIAVIMVPLLLWTFLLFLEKKQPLADRVILLFLLAGFAMILMVEVIVLSGDVGRMNTVFKFYLQAWTFLSISAAYSFVNLFGKLRRSPLEGWKKTWRTIGIVLVCCGLMFPIAATMDKVTDRISDDVPLTLDGMEYMQTSVYWQDSVIMDLEQDYQGIIWMQENVEGSPVIVEGNVALYQWGNRYSIYTGLPGVIGWDWHQRQQKQILPSNYVSDRIDEVEAFYNTTDIQTALEFLEKYGVKYVVLGQLEHIIYSQEGLTKFTDFEGVYWQTVFAYKDTIILEVME